MMHNGRNMKSITAGDLHANGCPDDMDDTWVLLPGRKNLFEVWDYRIERDGENVVLFGNFEDTSVPPDHPIYYTDFSEKSAETGWTTHYGDDYVRVLETPSSHTEEMVAEVYGETRQEQEKRAQKISATLELGEALDALVRCVNDTSSSKAEIAKQLLISKGALAKAGIHQS